MAFQGSLAARVGRFGRVGNGSEHDDPTAHPLRRDGLVLRLLCALTLALVLVLALAPPALAQDDDDYDAGYDDEEEYDDEDEEEDEGFLHIGAYGTFAGVIAFGADRREGIENDVYGGANLRVGWRENEWLALELEVEWVVLNDISYGIWTYGANGKIFMSEDRIQPYLLLGAGGMTQKRDTDDVARTDWGLRFGLGVEYQINRRWGLIAEGRYILGVGDMLDRDYGGIDIGALYRF